MAHLCGCHSFSFNINCNRKGSFTLTAATATETQIFFPSRKGYIGPYGSVHMETCGKGISNQKGPIRSIFFRCRCRCRCRSQCERVFTLKLIACGKARSHYAIGIAIFLIATNGLYRFLWRCSQCPIATTSPSAVQHIVSKNKSQSEIVNQTIFNKRCRAM